MKKVFLSSLLIFGAVAANAQFLKFHAGLTTGINSTIQLDKGLSEDPRYNATYTYAMSPIGVSFGMDVTRKFGLSLEGIKSFQQQVYNIIDAAEKVKGTRKIEFNYFQMPMLFKLMSGGNAGTRANFNLGPQLSFLSDAKEMVEAQAGTYVIPDGTDFATIQQEFPNATDNGNGTYNLPSDIPSTELYSKKANDFKNTQFSIAGAFGLDIDLSKHLYLTTQIRATYSLTEVTNGEVLDQIQAGNGNSLVGEQANVVVGLQLGLHYMFGVTRSFMQR